jgi:hypothetical protein
MRERQVIVAMLAAIVAGIAVAGCAPNALRRDHVAPGHVCMDHMDHAGGRCSYIVAKELVQS